MRVKLLNSKARSPFRGSTEAAGYDLYSTSDAIVTHGKATKVRTGVAVAIPIGCVGLIKPRSGLAFADSVDTMAGVIDSDYRGELKILLTCHATQSPILARIYNLAARIVNCLAKKVVHDPVLEIKPVGSLLLGCGERVAQLLIVPVKTPEIEVVDELDDTERGENGFGSTGKK